MEEQGREIKRGRGKDDGTWTAKSGAKNECLSTRLTVRVVYLEGMWTESNNGDEQQYVHQQPRVRRGEMRQMRSGIDGYERPTRRRLSLSQERWIG